MGNEWSLQPNSWDMNVMQYRLLVRGTIMFNSGFEIVGNEWSDLNSWEMNGHYKI